MITCCARVRLLSLPAACSAMVLSVRGEGKQGRWVYPIADSQGERETGRKESGKQGRRLERDET